MDNSYYTAIFDYIWIYFFVKIVCGKRIFRVKESLSLFDKKTLLNYLKKQVIMSNYKVRVICRTYNQCNYITNTLKGFVIQETNFPFVCVIIDDASTDGEQKVINSFLYEEFEINDSNYLHKETEYAIIRKAQHKYNRNCTFVVLFLKENHYSINKSTLSYIDYWGEITPYTASCEGDDYWISASKLQKQVDYLDNNSEYGAVYTDFVGLKDETGEEVDMHVKYLNGWQYETMLKENLNIWTLTVCYRTKLRNYMPVLPIDTYFVGDILLFLTLTSKSKVYCLPEKTAVYRYLLNSASHFSDNSMAAIKFRAKCLRTYEYFVDHGPNISDETRKLVKSKVARATISEAYHCDEQFRLKNVSYPLSSVRNIKTLLIFVLQLGRNKFIFKLIRKFLNI